MVAPRRFCFPKQLQTIAGGPAPLFFEDFTALDIWTPGHTNGLWRPNATWQDGTRGYRDFAGVGAYNLAPSSPATAPLISSPFTITPTGSGANGANANGVLTITSRRLTAFDNANSDLAAFILMEMADGGQGAIGSTPNVGVMNLNVTLTATQLANYRSTTGRAAACTFSSGGHTSAVTPLTAGSSVTAIVNGSPVVFPYNWCPAWLGGFLVGNGNVASMSWNSGYIEARSRLPIRGKGMFPAWWSFDATSATSQEIDYWEVFGAPQNFFSTSVHITGISSTIGTYTLADYVNADPVWHLFGIDWQPQNSVLDFYVDRVFKYGTSNGVLTPAEAAGTVRPMAVILNYAMNANWFAPQNWSDGSTPNTMTYEIDSVTRWAARPF